MFPKKSLVLLSLLGVVGVSTVYADEANSSITPQDINLKLSIPQAQPGMEYDLTFLELKPSASNLDYAILNKELPTQSPTWQEQELDPSYTPAFALGAHYTFNGTGRDFNANWTHLNSYTSSSVSASDANYFVGPNYEIGPDAITIRSSVGSANFKYDVINADLGQHLAFGKSTDIRFFGGLSTGFLREEVKSSFMGNARDNTGADYPGGFQMDTDNYSNFSGIGPRLGMEIDYATNYGFSLLAEGGASALIGTSRTRMDTQGMSSYLTNIFHQSVNYQNITDQNSTQVVPGFDGKLGLSYKTKLRGGALFTGQLGYEAAVYINAINEYQPQSVAAPIESGGIYVNTMSHTQSNYSVQGPFLKFGLQF